MIRTIHIEVHAANPNLPLEPIEVFEGSAASLTILNIPRAHGQREVTGVTAIVTDMEGVTRGFGATRAGSAWNVTIPASALGHSGEISNGLLISANGTDESGAVVPSWLIGVADVRVMRSDGSVAPGEVRDTVHFYETAPANPSRGDIAPIEGVLKLFNGEEWMDIGGGSSGGAIVLRISDGKVFDGDVEITSFVDLLAMVQAGGVTLLNTVGGNPKDALYYPHYCDETGIRFDATGVLGSAVQTRSIVMQPKSDGGIIVTPGSLVEIAKKADVAPKDHTHANLEEGIYEARKAADSSLKAGTFYTRFKAYFPTQVGIRWFVVEILKDERGRFNFVIQLKYGYNPHAVVGYKTEKKIDSFPFEETDEQGTFRISAVNFGTNILRQYVTASIQYSFENAAGLQLEDELLIDFNKDFYDGVGDMSTLDADVTPIVEREINARPHLEIKDGGIFVVVPETANA